MASQPDPKNQSNHLTPNRAIDLTSHVTRLRRLAEEYRVLADVARTDGARQSYIGIASDYDDLAGLAEETLIASNSWWPGKK